MKENTCTYLAPDFEADLGQIWQGINLIIFHWKTLAILMEPAIFTFLNLNATKRVLSNLEIDKQVTY